MLLLLLLLLVVCVVIALLCDGVPTRAPEGVRPPTDVRILGGPPMELRGPGILLLGGDAMVRLMIPKRSLWYSQDNVMNDLCFLPSTRIEEKKTRRLKKWQCDSKSPGVSIGEGQTRHANLFS